jgi:hypothetical protein
MALQWKMLAYFMTIWNILRPFGIVCGHLVLGSLWSLGKFFPFWYVWTKKNLATLIPSPFSCRLRHSDSSA